MNPSNHTRAIFAIAVFLLTLQRAGTAGAQTITLENPHVALNVDSTLGAITSIQDKDLGITYQITGVSFALASDRGNLQALTPTSNSLVGDTLTFTFSTTDFDIDLHYQLGADNHFVEKWLELTTKDGLPCQIGTVTLEEGTLGPQFEQIHFHDDNTIWQCPINLFLRGENGGCFAGISYPYWEMDLNGNSGFSLGFAPNYTLPAAETFVSEKYFLGVYRREGIHRYSQGPYPGAVPNPYVSWGGTAGITQHFKSGVVPAQAVPSEILDWGEVWAMQKFMEHVLPDDLPLPEPGFWIWQNGWWAGLFTPDNAILDQLKLAGVHDVMTANTWYGRGTHPAAPPYIVGMRIDPLGFPEDGVPGSYTADFVAPAAFDSFHQYGQSIGGPPGIMTILR